MWIKCTNEATRRLYNDAVMDAPVSFSENGTAQVTETVGEQLIEHYDAIIPYTADND